MIYYWFGSEREVISDDALRAALSEALEGLELCLREGPGFEEINDLS